MQAMLYKTAKRMLKDIVNKVAHSDKDTWQRLNSLEHAIALAAKAHEGQVDKAGAPYIC